MQKFPSKNDGMLSLNVKMLLILHLVWKANRILQYGSLFFIMRLILVRIWRDNLPKYGRAITKFFLGNVLTTGLISSILSKNYLMHLLFFLFFFVFFFYNNDLQLETKNKQKTYNSAPISMLCDVGGKLNVKNTKYDIKIY